MEAKFPEDPYLDTPVDILCSYFYFSDIDMAEVRGYGTRIIGDSGAFSAATLGKPIDRDEFYSWAVKWSDSLLWAAALDVIGDPDASFKNWLAGKDTVPRLIPTIHYGESPGELDRLADHGATLVGLGGMVPYKSEPKRLLRWCLSVFRYAAKNHPEMKFHGWGTTHPELVNNLPWWSTDSSGFASSFRFGVLRLFDPRTAKTVSANLDGRDLAKHRELLARYYQVDWRRIAVSTGENRREVGRVSMRAMQLLGKWLQRRFQVSPPEVLIPALGEGDGPLLASVQEIGLDKMLGPRLHSVVGVTGNAGASTLLKRDR